MRIVGLVALGLAIATASYSAAGDKNKPQVSYEMKDFLKRLDGTVNGVNSALKKYAADKVDTSAMEGIMVREPKVTKVEAKGGETTYTVEVKTGILERTYVIRWKDKRIQKIEQAAIK